MAVDTPDPLAALLGIIDPAPSPYLRDPEGWVRDVTGGFMTRHQRAVARSVVKHRYTAVPSAHGMGKSRTAAALAAWWLDVHPVGEAFVVTTAPTWAQVRAVLWREIGKVHRAGEAHGHRWRGQPFPSCEWRVGDELVAYGRKPADYDESAFQGIHARYVLVVVDEAGGIPRSLWDGVDSIVTNEDSRVLAIGNPDDPTSHFERICRPDSGWHVVPIDGLTSPNFTEEGIAPYPLLRAYMEEHGIEPTREEVPDWLRPLLLSPLWVEERLARWGASSPLFQAKVRGQFAQVSDWSVIPPGALRAAIDRDIEPTEPGVYGLDVAREGRDATVLVRNQNGRIRVEWRRVKQDTMETANQVEAHVRPHKGECPVVVDAIGLGAGVFDRLRELQVPVSAFIASEKPRAVPAPGDPRFANRRAEAWWAAREAFEAGEVDLDPADEDLIAQLGSMRYRVDARGVIHIESKDEWKKRLGGDAGSPDDADAAVMTFVPPDRAPKRRTGGRAPMSLTAGLLDRDL